MKNYNNHTLRTLIEANSAWRGAGVAIPLFSLRSEESMGVGDFGDLKKMVDWAVATSQRVIQILPINDTTMNGTWEDSYPYNANSIFALHPQYIAVREIATLADSALRNELESEGRRLNALASLDYVGVMELKTRYLRALYDQMGGESLESAGFKKFFAKNRSWLEPYALFSTLRDKYATPNFSEWGDEATYSEKLLRRYCTKRSKSYSALAYYYFVQYHLHLQLSEAHEYAHSRGVAFKGDIPIGVSRTSADVWINPRLYRLDSQAGAPPDDFSVLGQNWGFPTYNWEEMAKDNFAWWSARFEKMAEYFDAYRIDHILGFFRIWEIPLDAVHGLLGHFNPAKPLTIDEMRESYGFYFENEYREPAINDWLIGELFGVDAEGVTAKYLKPIGGERYALKPKYGSQLKIAQNVENQGIRDRLMLLLDEVLFIEDPYKRGCYHPRISAQNTYKYRALNDWDKACYDNLYNDFYYYRHNDFWYGTAMQKLPTLINSTNMLTCGEDLGMIPHCVPRVMEELSIHSLEIQRMAKNPSVEFDNPANYPYLSVCTTSTHDMNPIRAWLLEDRETTARYLREMFGIEEEIGDDIPASICERVVLQHLASPAMLTILPLQDWLSIFEGERQSDPHSERINIPANSRHYWRYRMHCTLEHLVASSALNEKIRESIVGSGR